VDGQWGTFGSWSSCSVTCGGGGVRTRERSCDSPSPSGGGADCIGNSTNQEDCNTDNCPGENTCVLHAIQKLELQWMKCWYVLTITQWHAKS